MAGAAVLGLALAACSSPSGTEAVGQQSLEASPAASGAAAASSPMSDVQASDYFLTTVCPVTTALRIVENLQIEAGGWKFVKPKATAKYVQSASDQLRQAATKLTAEGVVWPDKLRPSIEGMKENFLGMIVPLQAMASATTGAAMASPWQQVALNPRIAEQQARLDLGLPAANAPDDGCPPVPTPQPRPRVTSTPNTSGDDNQTGTSSDPNRWQSPSGNLRCAYFSSGSQGPSVACLDSDNNRLVILNQGYTRTMQASSSQRSQLGGGSVLDFGDPPKSLGGGTFTCDLTDEGMTCQDRSYGAWFIIRRGYLWTSD